MCRLLWAAPIPGYFVSYWNPSSFTLGTCYLFNQIIMVGFGSLWTFSSGFLLFLLHSPLFCSGNFSLHKKRLSITAYIQILHLLRYKKCSFCLPFFRYFYTYMQFFAMFLGVFLAVISFTRLCNSAVWNDFPQYGKRNALQVPASGTKIVLNILSYFCQPLQCYPILKNVTLIMT